uniref:Right handed beta helix domain-containing protein n=1 Tax=Amphimedon queenslandica TaxID=400682 RepID=A0A1X7TRR4_AMPQE
MSPLLVVVLLFFSSSCSVSSHQYYVSDDCSSVTQSPCNPLSVYAGDMSQYNNTIFYFIGTSSISYYVVNMMFAENVTLYGLDQSPNINCKGVSKTSIFVFSSNDVTISNISFSDCSLEIHSSNNITISNSSFIRSESGSLQLQNAFDVNISSSVYNDYQIFIWYTPLLVCSDELPHYSLILTNVNLTQLPDAGKMQLVINHGNSYNVSIIFDHLHSAQWLTLELLESIFHFFITKSSFDSTDQNLGFWIKFGENSAPTKCSYPGITLAPNVVLIEESQLYNNWYGFQITTDKYLPGTMNYHIIIKSCLMYDNEAGLFIDATFLRFLQIDIIDTELIGNGGNKIMNSNAISFSNVTVASSTSTGLTLVRSLVTIKNNLIFKNNTGVVGGGLAINDSSRLILTSSANLEFIDNHASYKGGGIYVEESTSSDMKLMAPNIPLTLIHNTAGLVGGDMYGYHRSSGEKYQFNLTNPHISSTGNPMSMCSCDPHAISIAKSCSSYVSEQHIYPGQTLQYHVALFGYNYLRSLTPTDGTVQVYNDTNLINQTYIPNTCSLIEYIPKLTQSGYQSDLAIVIPSSLGNQIFPFFIVNECPIGFRLDKSQGSCICSQSVSRENVTCDINSLNITHNGLLWIGTYHMSTPFNANATNPNACIINEDCLLYCSPSPVTFKLNDTHTQCVDNRRQRMCGSCTEGYSLLMGSNKCGQCHINYMMIAWIALFAVMGVLLVVLLIALNLTVSVGTLNGLLFYANIVKLYEPVFSRKGALPVLSQVISWINLDFGFEICFYNGMDSYAKQWLQFAFPLYLWIIIIIIIQLCRRYGKISRLMGSHAVPVLSTLTFLSYTKLVRTIVIVLHKREVTLHCTNESVRSVSLWYQDPNVEYAKGKHAGLFGFALLVTVFFVIPYTLFLLLNRFLEKYLSNFKVFRKIWSHFKPIIDAYSGPMKDEYRFWPGLLLVARIPVLLTVTFLKNESRVLLLAAAAFILSLSFIFGGVYRKKLNNIIEFWFLLNLCIMASLSIAFTGDSKVLIWYNTCLSVFIFSFILIVVYHLYLQLSHMKCYDALIKKLFKKQDEDDEPLLDVTESVKTVDQQRQEIVPSSTDVRRCASRESVVDLY